MTERDEQILIGQLLAMRAQIDASLVTLGVPLEGDAFEDDATASAGEQASGCSHPREARLDMTCFGGPEHWRCLGCGHEEYAPDDADTSTTTLTTTQE